MNYVDLRTKLLADITDFLDNGFKQKLVKAVEDKILPELQGLVVDLHQKALEARDGTCVHYRDMLQKHIDRKTENITDRIGTMEMYMPQVRVLGEAVKELEKETEQQRVATAKLETCTEHLQEATRALGGKVNGQAGKINILEDKPGKKALNDVQKRRALFTKIGVAVVIALVSAAIGWLV